jgi:beta-glucosidase
VSAWIANDLGAENPIGYRETHVDVERTPIGWPVTPEAMPGLLGEITERYRPRAMYITESGASYDDPPPANGVVCDPERTEFLRRHFVAAHQAIAAGVPLRGYFVWTLMDNFEWIWGFARRFGVVQLDRETQARTIKASGRLLERVARANAVPAN